MRLLAVCAPVLMMALATPAAAAPKLGPLKVGMRLGPDGLAARLGFSTHSTRRDEVEGRRTTGLLDRGPLGLYQRTIDNTHGKKALRVTRTLTLPGGVTRVRTSFQRFSDTHLRRTVVSEWLGRVTSIESQVSTLETEGAWYKQTQFKTRHLRRDGSPWRTVISDHEAGDRVRTRTSYQRRDGRPLLELERNGSNRLEGVTIHLGDGRPLRLFGP
jgi:hypothetical protein